MATKVEIESVGNEVPLDRILNAIKTSRMGQMLDADLHREFQDINPKERASIINSLIDSNEIELLLDGEMVSYQYKKQIVIPKEVHEYEESVYRLIAESSTMGIWKRDIRNRVNIDGKELTKMLSSMEKRKLIKKINAAVGGNTMKIRFILFSVIPDKSITGGAFFDGDKFDKELVEGITDILKPYLRQLRDNQLARCGDHLQEVVRNSSVTAESIAQWLNSKNFVKFQLSHEDTSQLLDALVLEGFAIKQDSSYRAKIHDRSLTTSGLSLSPCGVCPVIAQCQPGGLIAPETCKYLDDFLF